MSTTPTAAANGDDGTDTTTLAQYRRMFLAACEDLGLINEVLGLDPEQGGAAPILYAIKALQKRASGIAEDDDTVSAAAHDVLTERQRQISAECWTPEHDDEHVNDELAAMACFYLMPDGARDWDATSTGYGDTLGEAMRPADWHAKTGDRRRELVKGAALALAEIERLDRAAARMEPRA